MSVGINSKYRAIPAVSKHIVPQEALSGRSKRIRIDESADAGVVITALQVVEPGFSGGAVAVMVFAGIL